MQKCAKLWQFMEYFQTYKHSNVKDGYFLRNTDQTVLNSRKNQIRIQESQSPNGLTCALNLSSCGFYTSKFQALWWVIKDVKDFLFSMIQTGHSVYGSRLNWLSYLFRLKSVISYVFFLLKCSPSFQEFWLFFWYKTKLYIN